MEADKKQESAEITEVNIGELLVEARENQSLSAIDIASQLNLTVSIIDKIEENQFEQDIPLAFIRGYVRSYAQKVGLDVKTICAEFDRQSQKNEEPVQSIQRISHFSKKRKEINTNNTLFKVVSYLIVISLLSVGGWEVWKRFGPKTNQNETDSQSILLDTKPESNEENGISLNLSSTQTTDAQQEVQATGTNDTDTSLVGLEANELSTETVSQVDNDGSYATDIGDANSEKPGEPANSSLPERPEPEQPEVQTEVLASSTQSEVESSRASEEQRVVLLTEPVIETEFVFTGDCWVQVKDANGEVIALGVKKSGKIMPLAGVAPFNVILGEPSVVKITLSGEAFDLSAFSPGRTARFVLQ